MPHEQMHVLLLEPDPADAATFRELAVDRSPEPCLLETARTFTDAMDALSQGHYDAVVVDALAGDGTVLSSMRQAASEAALLVLKAHDDAVVPLDPADVGIQSTLELEHLDERTLPLALRLAVERHRLTRALEASQAQTRELAAAKSLRDPLTGLAMGERLLEDTDTFIADAVRFGRPLTVAIADIDGFGKLNTDRGPALADAILVHIAGRLEEELRSSDLVGRLGSDEFLMVMPGTGADHALIAVRRIQERLQRLPYALPDGRRIHASICVGVAGLQGLMAVDELVFEADKALERARRQGRGGCVMASGPGAAIHVN